MTKERLVAVNNVTVSFGSRRVLDNVSLTIAPAEIVTLIGPNGAGKSTLVKIAIGLLQPDSGSAHIKSGLRIGYMPQKLAIDNLMPLSVKRFLSLTNGIVKSEIPNVAHELGIMTLLEKPIQKISGGEFQRVLLARALLRKPDLLVLDEPVQGVDIMGQTELYQLIAKIRDKYGCGILMVSHDLHLVMSGTDKVLCLNQHVCCSGHPEDVKKLPEYISLFGEKAAEDLAVYTHHHNHHHTLDGGIADG